tara:strand:+ start:1355 stop:1615 length:261 start_codon:yes stop_codon:yes gene_type:complete
MKQKVIKTIELTPTQRETLKKNAFLNAYISENTGKNVTTYIKPYCKSAAEFHMQTDDLKNIITIVIGKRGKIDSIYEVQGNMTLSY